MAGLRGVIFNDAGVGKDNAGIGSLDYLQGLGLAAAAIAHTSARIGDGADMLKRGRISFCNAIARALGCEEGQACREAAEVLCHGKPLEGDVPGYEESRSVLQEVPVLTIACDSASLVTPEDAGAFIITGSHGGVIAGRPDYGIAAEARSAVFNDAGVGIDRAGVRRLEVLDRAGIPAGTVDAMTACIRRCGFRMGKRCAVACQFTGGKMRCYSGDDCSGVWGEARIKHPTGGHRACPVMLLYGGHRPYIDMEFLCLQLYT